MNLTLLGSIFLVLTLSGYYLAYRYGHRTRKFNWIEYLGIIFWPTIFILVLTYLFGYKLLKLFFISAFLGLALEYVLGLAYHKIMGKHLWMYRKFDLNHYTSWLCLPIWGIAGVIFWYIGKISGL